MGIPGLIGQYEPEAVNDAARRMYSMGWILTFVTAATVYYACLIFIKLKVFPSGQEGAPSEWEWLANEGREGFFEGEREGELYAPPTPILAEAETVHMGEKAQKIAE